MRGLGYPDTVYEYMEWMLSDPANPTQDPNVSDGSLIVYNSNFQPSSVVTFQAMWPSSLSEIDFTAASGDVEYAVATVTFKYALYNLTNYEP